MRSVLLSLLPVAYGAWLLGCSWLRPACAVVKVASDTCGIVEVDGVAYKATPATIESLGLRMAAEREARAEAAMHGDGGAR